MKTYPDLRYLERLALRAGDIMREYFYRQNEREWKEDATPVTIADKEINQMVLERITRDFPHVNAIGEEGRREVPGAKYTVTWDPIDGTYAFMVGSAVSAFCISVLKEDTPLLAVIYDPLGYKARMWWAEKGQGAFMNNDLVHVSTHRDLARAQICMIWWGGCRYNLHDVAGALMAAGADVQNPVSLAYYGGLVASGNLEVAMFPGKNIWETAAMQCIVEEAGGCVTNIHGDPVQYHQGDIQGCIVSNGLVHEAVVEMVRSHQ